MAKLDKVEVQTIPHNLDIETMVLGNVLLSEGKLMSELVDSVEPKMFYDETNKLTYTIMLYLHYNHLPIGYETIIERFNYKNDELIKKNKKSWDLDTYVDYLVSLSSSVASSSTFNSYKEMLIDYYRKREVYKLSLDLVTTPLEGIASSNLVKKVENTIDGMGITSNIEIDNFSDYIDEWVDVLEDNETQVQKYKMGYKLLDDMILIEPSNLMLVSARPSLGKSAFALNLTKNFCLQGKKTLFVSLEMSKREIMNRLVANLGKVPAQKLKRKLPLDSSEWSNIMSAKEHIKQWSLNIYDKGGMYIEQLEGLAKFLKKKGELDVIIVDYLQLLDTHSHNKNRVQQVSYISRKLKQIAMELEIPVIALSQLSRAGVTDGGKPREPQLSDLRESGK